MLLDTGVKGSTCLTPFSFGMRTGLVNNFCITYRMLLNKLDYFTRKKTEKMVRNNLMLLEKKTNDFQGYPFTRCSF